MPPKASNNAAVQYSTIAKFPSVSARRHEGRYGSQPTSCFYGSFFKEKHYDVAVEHAASLQKIKNWDAEACGQVKTKLQSVLQLAADLTAEHHAVLDHRLYHARKPKQCAPADGEGNEDVGAGSSGADAGASQGAHVSIGNWSTSWCC